MNRKSLTIAATTATAVSSAVLVAKKVKNNKKDEKINTYRNTELGKYDKNDKGIYYTNGNYEAFARPKKPEGVENKNAYLIGSGLASLAAACFLVRDGQMPGKNIHILDGLTKDYEKECLGYERKIKEMGGIHLFIGGVGEDGHIAFNEPFSSLSSRTRVKTLTESTIKANSRFFDYDLSKVPTQALTVGVGTIMDAEEVMILATGKNKAQALKHSIEGSISHVWTLSELQRHQHGIIVCDKDASSDLSEQTVKYFLEIQSKIPG